MSLLFEEFPPVSTADWEAQIARDLKGRDPKTLTSWSKKICALIQQQIGVGKEG